jgi:exodeoxyribonuclease-5
MVLGVLTGSDGTDSARDWLARVSVLEERRGGLPGRDTPSNWVVLIDDVLKKLNWPGSDSMNSVEFQLVNRWRELLNDLARLQLVVATMTFAEVVARLHTMAGETLFQPELDGALVHLLGPLEAAGLRFGKLWVSGFSATNWPPPGRPSSLISRSVQCSYGMPDATPDDTLDYAQRIWRRLAGSAEQVVCSYPQTDGDIEQSESGLLANVAASRTQGREDPGWHARRLVGHTSLVTVDNDRVPTVSGDEFLSGGAATIQRQFVEPFAAFVFGRLGVRSIPIIISGLTAGLRGSLIHDALHHLYADLPAKREIHSWNESELQQRIESALQESFRRQERHADLTLRQLLQLERARVASLLRAVVAQDLTREDFSVADVEKSVETEISGVRLRLRIDRIDQIAGDQVIVLDYKTGIRKQLLDSDGNPRDMQLVVYARALRETVTAVGLINVDSRGVAIDAIGRDFAPDLDWDEAMADWKAQVDAAADEIRQGDVRINMQQNVQAARPLGLLSRIRELQRDA